MFKWEAPCSSLYTPTTYFKCNGAYLPSRTLSHEERYGNAIESKGKTQAQVTTALEVIKGPSQVEESDDESSTVISSDTVSDHLLLVPHILSDIVSMLYSCQPLLPKHKLLWQHDNFPGFHEARIDIVQPVLEIWHTKCFYLVKKE